MPDGRIAITTVDIDTDRGATLLIASGLDPTDQVVLNPDGLFESGVQVEIAQDTPSSRPSAEPPAGTAKQP